MHGDNYKYKASPTKVLGLVPSWGLIRWWKNTSPSEIRERETTGKEAGTDGHKLIADWINGVGTSVETAYQEEVQNARDSLLLCLKEHPITLKSAEIQFDYEKYKYSGMIDSVGTYGLNLSIIDWKLKYAKDKEVPPIYDEFEYQIAMYFQAYRDIFNSEIKQGISVVLAKDKVAYNLKIISAKVLNEHFKNYCLPLLKMWNYKNRRKK